MKPTKQFFLLFLVVLAIGLGIQRHEAHAGTWVASHCGGSDCEGTGAKVAAADEACLFPYSAGVEACPTYSGSVTQCTSYSNNLSCHQGPPDDRQPCSGGAIHTCNFGEFLNASSRCVKKVKNKHCGLIKANPVDVTTGEKVQEELDWSSGGDHPLLFKRTYSGFSDPIKAPSYSRLGPKWRSNFDAAATYVLSAGVGHQECHSLYPKAEQSTCPYYAKVCRNSVRANSQ